MTHLDSMRAEAEISDFLRKMGRGSYTKMCEMLESPKKTIASVLYNWEKAGVIRKEGNEYTLCVAPEEIR